MLVMIRHFHYEFGSVVGHRIDQQESGFKIIILSIDDTIGKFLACRGCRVTSKNGLLR